MNFYTSAPKWDHGKKVPHTSSSALPTEPLRVKGKVITVRDAEYRGATFSGRFLLAEEVSPVDKTTRRVKIYCRWFGHGLKEEIPMFIINLATSTIDDDGTVYTDFYDGIWKPAK